MRMLAEIYDKTGKPVVFSLWTKSQTNNFHEFVTIVLYFVAVGTFTADVGLAVWISTWNSRTGHN